MVPIDNEATRRALRAATARLTGFLRGVEHPDTPIPDSEWTIRQGAAHVVSGLTEYGTSLAEQSPLPQTDPSLGPANAQIREISARRMIALQTNELPELASMIDDAVEAFLAKTEGRDPAEPFDWFGMRDSSLGAMTAIMLGEVLLHGYDMARATRTRWPIAPADATSIVLGGLDLLPAFVNKEAARGVRASYEVALRGGPRVGVRFENESASVEFPASGPFDCRLSADPVAMLLVSYGRIGPVAPALRGRIVAWGRKPWLGFKFAKMIMSP